ncbi:hypothetical protein ACFL3T_04195 [Patescibacteria group bacterium]
MTTEGKDHDRLVAAEILDIGALGEDLKEVVEANLATLTNGIELEPEDLVENTKFYNAIRNLNNLANDRCQYQILNFGDIAFITEVLQEFDRVIQNPNVTAEMLETQTQNLKEVAKRIIKAFTLSNKLPEQDAPEVTKPRLRVVEMLARLMKGLPRDK